MTAHRRRAADRLYAPAVIAGGALVLALRAATETISQPPLLAALLGVAVVASTVKVRLPMARGQATLSMSYFTDVIGLLLVGPLGAMLVASAGAAAQCAFLSRSRPTWLRTLFSVAVLVVTIECTARTATALGGFAPQATLLHLATVTLATATVFFVVNSGLVAIAVALSRREPVVRTWYAEFLWTAPMCLISVVSAVVVVQAHSAYLWAALLAAGPLYITLKCRTCTWPAWRPWRGPSTRVPRASAPAATTATCAACRCGPSRSARPPAWRRRTSKPSRWRRCCTTSASWRCPSRS
jgi:hypothetical protein